MMTETIASETEVIGTTHTQPTKKRPLDDGTTELLSIEAASEALYRNKFMLAPMVRVVSCTARCTFVEASARSRSYKENRR
jgi:hypothetical protein